ECRLVSVHVNGAELTVRQSDEGVPVLATLPQALLDRHPRVAAISASELLCYRAAVSIRGHGNTGTPLVSESRLSILQPDTRIRTRTTCLPCGSAVARNIETVPRDPAEPCTNEDRRIPQGRICQSRPAPATVRC